MTISIFPADKKFRKQVIITTIICLPLCVIVYYLVSEYFRFNLQLNDPKTATHRAKNLIFYVAIINGAISSLLAAYLVLISFKIFRHNQFPTPDMRVIKDTKIKTGTRAKLIGFLLIIVAVLALSSNYLLYDQFMKLNSMLAEALKEYQPIILQ